MPNAHTSQNLTADQAKAALGNATHLQDQLLGSSGQQSQPQPQQTNMKDMMNAIGDLIDKKLTGFKKELLTDLEDEENKASENNSEA